MNILSTTQVEATLGRKLISRADQFFSHSFDCIIDEMIQNSRRARAKNVHFTLEDGDLIIADDGHGLTAENAHVLLMAGGSNNDAAVEINEAAAGLGFFALAHYDVVVRSHNWEMQIPKAAFTGNATAALTTGHPHQGGLSIRIRSFTDRDGLRLGEIIQKCVVYSGLTATLKGFPEGVPTVVMPQTFLDHALKDHADCMVAVHTDTVHGVTIKLARIKGEMWRKEKTKLNFFGKVISLEDHRAGHRIPDVEKTVTLDEEKKLFNEASFCTMVLIDVHDTSRLKLKLPERDVLIQNDGLEEIWKTIDLLYCKMLSNPDLVNGLSAHHPLHTFSPYPIPRPSASVANMAGTRWMPKGNGLISAEGDRLELHEIVSLSLESYGVQDGGYLESMLESSYSQGGCPEVARILFDVGEIEYILGRETIPFVVGNTLLIKAEGDEIQVPLDDGLGSPPQASITAVTSASIGSSAHAA
jgi:hypothetical protein